MTAATLDSNKSKAKSLLGKIKKYEERIIDAINSIKMFPNYPLLYRNILNISLFILMLVIIFIIIPPMAGFIYASKSRLLLKNIMTNKTLLSIISKLKPNSSLRCIDGEVQYYRGELQYRECAISLSEKGKMEWIISSSIVYTLPELINSFLCFINAKNKPSTGQFFSVFIPETFHTIGIALMTFEVLPKLNFNYCVLFLIWCVIEWGLNNSIFTIYGLENIKFKSFLIVTDIVCLGIFINFTIFNPFDGINRNNSDCWIAILALALLNCGLWQDDSYYIFNLMDYMPPVTNGHRILEPVKDSIYAWVSLWKIIVFFASSYAMYVINHGETIQLFEIYGPALSLPNITNIPLSFEQIDFNATQYNELINLTRRLLLPSFTTALQLTIALLINVRTITTIASVIARFVPRSSWGMSIPFLVSTQFILCSQYLRSHNYYLFHNISLFEQLMNSFSEIHVPDVVTKFLSVNSLDNWEANLLRLSFCWIALPFIYDSARYGSFIEDDDCTCDKTETPPKIEVYVISKN